MATMEMDPAELLPRFGLRSFRPGQDQVVQAVMGGEDVMCVMPTGGGKSLCYQLPSLALEGTTIVVSPLIALMKDQVDTLRERGISAALINSTLTAAEQNDAMRRMADGEYDLVYLAPERLRNSRFLEAVARARVSLLAVDEAHCISEWGHDFRPDYARLGQFRQRYLSGVQTIALTATATPTVREDICRLLGLRSPRMFVTGFARDNLRFQVEHCKGDREKDAWLLEYLTGQPGAGIIYAATRKRCEELAGWLPEKLRRPVGVYHAGLDPRERQQVQEQFMAGKLSAIVATNAFGMGIDKADLRYVVHYNMPGTLEAYYQEAGRAGRDGLPSECVLLFSYSDRHIQEFFIENRYPTAELVQKVHRFLLAREEDPIELTLAQVRDAVDAQASAEAVGTSETLLARAGVLKRLDSSSNHAVVRIDSDLPTLVDLLPREAKQRRRVLRVVEQLVGSHRHEDVYVRPQQICELAEINREQFARVMRELSGLKSFDYVPPFRGRAVHVVRRDLSFADLNIDFQELEVRKRGEYEKLEAVIAFARTGRCRQREILNYFGDASEQACGSCDRCQPVNPRLVAASGAGSAAQLKRSPASDDPNLCRGLRIVLSGIARTHGRFGKGLVAQMLCGSQNKKIQQWKLNRLSTYGMLSGLKQSQVSQIIDALTEVGLVTQVEVEQRRPTVQLTEDGKSVMLGRQNVPAALRLSHPLARKLAAIARGMEAADVTGRSAGITESSVDAASTATISNTATASNASDSARAPEEEGGVAVAAMDTDDDAMATLGGTATGGERASSVEDGEPDGPANELLERLIGRLKHWRRRVAAASGMPAFRVLTNATLERIAQSQPRSVAQLEAVPGVGPTTIEEYGFDLIELVVHTLQEDVGGGAGGSGSVVGASGSSAGASGSASTSTSTKANGNREGAAGYWSWRLLSDGYPAADVAMIRGLTMAQLVADVVAQGRAGRQVSLAWFGIPAGSVDGSAAEGAAPPAGVDAEDRAWKELVRLASAGGRG